MYDNSEGDNLCIFFKICSTTYWLSIRLNECDTQINFIIHPLRMVSRALTAVAGYTIDDHCADKAGVGLLGCCL